MRAFYDASMLPLAASLDKLSKPHMKPVCVICQLISMSSKYFQQCSNFYSAVWISRANFIVPEKFSDIPSVEMTNRKQHLLWFVPQLTQNTDRLMYMFGWSQWTGKLRSGCCQFCEAQQGRCSLRARHHRLKLLPRGGWDNSLASCQKEEKTTHAKWRPRRTSHLSRPKHFVLSEASELCQDPRRTSHLTRPKHFMLSEASELRQDPRRTSHLSRPKHFMLSEASELRQDPRRTSLLSHKTTAANLVLESYPPKNLQDNKETTTISCRSGRYCTCPGSQGPTIARQCLTN